MTQPDKDLIAAREWAAEGYERMRVEMARSLIRGLIALAGLRAGRAEREGR